MDNVKTLACVFVVCAAPPVCAQENERFRGEEPEKTYMQTLTGSTCLGVGIDSLTAMVQRVAFEERSHLSISFTFEWGRLESDEEGLLSMSVDDGAAGSSAEWGFAGTDLSRTSGNLTWAFPNVPAGVHKVAVHARVEGGDGEADLNDCGLTLFVIPKD